MNIPAQKTAHETIESVIARGDLAALTTEQRNKYYADVCKSLGLNPLTQPFSYIVLQGRTVLYAKRDATDQLRTLRGVSVVDLAESERDGIFIVKAKVQDATGRTDVSTGAVNLNGLKGEALANALMKAETKAKRRATLSICGLGFLDETEVDEVPEKLTKPAVDPTRSRALIAEISKIQTAALLHDWGADHSAEVNGYPEDLRKRIYSAFMERLKKLEDVAHMVVHDQDGERPAVPEDFEDEAREAEQWSISQRAIAARNGNS